MAVVVLKIVERGFFHPENTVTSFFEALGDRDAASARDLLLPIREPYSLALLQSAVLKSRGYTPPADVRVEQTDATRDRASVQVSFVLNGQRRWLSLDLRRDAQATVGLFHQWRISDGGLHPITIEFDEVDSLLVAGTPIPPASDRTIAELAAPPGGYTVSLPDQPLWEASPVVAYAGIDERGWSRTVRLEPTIKADARAEIDPQVRSYLDRCAQSTTLVPEKCPFSAYPYSTVRNVKWKIVKYPEYELSDYAGQVSISTITDGEATVTGDSVGYFGGTDPFSTTDRFAVSGNVELVGDTLTFQPA
ncbi:hypothetical protein [Acrocarpospora sp. B8E8]|uniref:hypothetical protein n=1 Tax=Acrocarpospora sp. B8E8 TaxID=3153572 RepID=UPI00325F9D43